MARHTYSARTKALMAAYRALVIEQRQMPESNQWTLGPLVKQAQAAAKVAMEADELNLR